MRFIYIKLIISAVPLDDYILKLQFNDGFVGFFDCKPYLDKGIFFKLKDVNEFNKAKVAFGTIEWPCGADFDPESIYEICQHK